MSQAITRFGVRCIGSTVVGPRGQVVIPVSARRELGIEPGTTLLVFDAFQGQGLALLKVDAIEKLVKMATENLTDLEELVQNAKESRPSNRRKKGS